MGTDRVARVFAMASFAFIMRTTARLLYGIHSCQRLSPAEAEIAHRLGPLLAFMDLGMMIGAKSTCC